jgi:hypothetical protein
MLNVLFLLYVSTVILGGQWHDKKGKSFLVKKKFVRVLQK